MAELLIPGVGNATGPQIGKEILVPGSGNYTSNSGAVTAPTLVAASAINIGTTFATPQVAFTRP